MPIKRNFPVLLLVLIISTSCANFLDQRTFQDEMEKESDDMWIPHEDFEVIPGDDGKAYRSRQEILRRTPLSNRSRNIEEYGEILSDEVQSLEEGLSQDEYHFYRENEDVIPSDSEKIYFLGLTSNEREEYIGFKKGGGIRRDDKAALLSATSAVRAPASYSKKYDQFQDNFVIDYHYGGPQIREGMKKDDIIELLGRPKAIGVAGNAIDENEKWSFSKAGQNWVVYFEQGRVHGWDVE